MKSQDKVISRFRALCLALPETNETDSFGHPNFRAGKRTFAAFELIEQSYRQVALKRMLAKLDTKAGTA